jgi:hypothetical protein
MISNRLSWILAISIALSFASLLNHAGAVNGESGCCVCVKPANGEPEAKVTHCVGIAGGGPDKCNNACPLLWAFSNSTCNAPELLETCGKPAMAPTSSPLGLIVLAAALAGLGTLLARKRSS